MRPTSHVYISAGVTVIFSIWVNSVNALVACFLSGIFIDLDHHLDYMISKKELPLSYKKLVDFLMNDHESKLYLIFHSYELIFLLWVSIFYFHSDVIWLGVAVGVTAHMICDEIANPLMPKAYFLTYRIKHKFCRKMFFSKKHLDEVSSH